MSTSAVATPITAKNDRQDRGGEQCGAEKPGRKQGGSEIASERSESRCGISRVGDLEPLRVESRCAGDDHEQADDAGGHRAHDNIDPLEREISARQALVDGV